MSSANVDVTPDKDKPSILGLFGDRPVALKTEFNKDPRDLSQDYKSNLLDVSLPQPSTIDKYNKDPSQKPRRSCRIRERPAASTSLAHKWAPTERLSEPTMGTFAAISEKIMDFIDSPTTGDCEELKESFKRDEKNSECLYSLLLLRSSKVEYFSLPRTNIVAEILGAICFYVLTFHRGHETAILFESLLQHIISFYPKLCNPWTEKGREALDGLVFIISYLTTEGCKNISYYQVTIQQIDSILSEYMGFAYPYPLTGREPFQKALRYQFVCLNNLALKLAETNLISDLRPAKKALKVINMMLPEDKVQCVNHESILIGSQWVKHCSKVIDRCSDEMKADWVAAWDKITKYEPAYQELPEEYKGYFEPHVTAINEARLAVEATKNMRESRYLKSWYPDNLERILRDSNLPSCYLFDEIRKLIKKARYLDAYERSECQKTLLEKMDAVDSLLRNENAAQEARNLAEVLEIRQADPY